MYIAIPAHLLALACRLIGMLMDLLSFDIIKHNYRVAIRIMLFLEQGKNKDNNNDDNEESVVRRRNARLG